MITFWSASGPIFNEFLVPTWLSRGGRQVVITMGFRLLGPSWRQDGPKSSQEAPRGSQDSFPDRFWKYFDRFLVGFLSVFWLVWVFITALLACFGVGLLPCWFVGLLVSWSVGWLPCWLCGMLVVLLARFTS